MRNMCYHLKGFTGWGVGLRWNCKLCLTIRGPCLRPPPTSSLEKRRLTKQSHSKTWFFTAALWEQFNPFRKIISISMNAAKVASESNLTECVHSALCLETHEFSILVGNQLILVGETEPISWLQNCKLRPSFTPRSQKQSSSVMDDIDGLQILACWTWAAVIFQSLRLYSNLHTPNSCISWTARRIVGEGVGWKHFAFLNLHNVAVMKLPSPPPR